MCVAETELFVMPCIAFLLFLKVEKVCLSEKFRELGDRFIDLNRERKKKENQKKSLIFLVDV